MDEKEHLQNKINAFSIVEEVLGIKRKILAEQITKEFDISTWTRLKDLDSRLRALDVAIDTIKNIHVALKFDMRLMSIAEEGANRKEKQ